MRAPLTSLSALASLLVLAGVTGGCTPTGPGAEARPIGSVDRTDATVLTTDAAATPPTELGADPPSVTAVDRDRALAAAVEVRADGCPPRVASGAGAFVDERLVVTAAHVVAGADRVELIGVDGDRDRADVVLFDPELDVAVLRSAHGGHPLVARSDDAAAGERGVVVVPRLADDRVEVDVVPVTVTRAVTIRTTDIYLEHDVARDGFELAGSIDVGDSGGVVVLPGGAAGVVWARSTRRDDRAWAVDLPPAVRDAGQRDELGGPVDTGRCLR